MSGLNWCSLTDWRTPAPPHPPCAVSAAAFAERAIVWVKTKQSWWPAQLERVSDASADVLASRPATAAGKSAVDALLVRLLGDTPSFQWIADSDDVFDFETGYRHKKPKKNSRPLVAALKEAFALLTEQGVDVELLKANAVAAAAAAAVAALSAPSMAEVVSPAAADVGVVTGKRKSRSATVAAAAAAAATAAATTTTTTAVSVPTPTKAATAPPRSSGKKRKAPPAVVVSRDVDDNDDDNDDNDNDNDDNNDDSREHEKKAKLDAEHDDNDDDKAERAAAVPTAVAETAASGAPEDATTTVAPAAAAATPAVVAKKKRGRGAGKKRLSDTSAGGGGGDAVEDVASMRSSPTLGYGAVSPHVDGAASMPPPAAVPVPARRKQQPRRKSMSDVGHVFESRLDLYKARVHDRAVGVFSGNELAGAESIILMRSSGTPLRVLRDDGDQIVIEIDCDDATQASLLVGAFRASHAHARSVRIIRAWTLGGAHAPASGYRHDGSYGVVPAAAHNDGAVKREGDAAAQRQWLLSKILVAAPPPATAPTSAPHPQPPTAGTPAAAPVNL
jgi:hypothetical protein